MTSVGTTTTQRQPLGQLPQQNVLQPLAQLPLRLAFPVPAPRRRVNVAPIATTPALGAAALSPGTQLSPLVLRRMSLVPTSPRGGPQTAPGAAPVLFNVTVPRASAPAAAPAKKQSIAFPNTVQPSGRKASRASRASLRASVQLPSDKRPVIVEGTAAADDSDAIQAADSRKRRAKAQEKNEPETLWERWWPFAFAVAPPQRDEILVRESNKRRRERIRRLQMYDEGRDFEQFTDSYQGDSSQGSIGADEQPVVPDTPAGHYSKAHPYYKKLRLPSGRRVDITRRNYFLRKWRDRKVKTTYHVFAILTGLFALVCLVMYAYKENLPWLYNIIKSVRDVAQGTPGEKRRTSPLQLQAHWKDPKPATDGDTGDDDYVTETSETSSEGTGTPGGAFAVDDDLRKRLV